MKKLLLISILLPSISFASVIGIGEYFYGPDTSDNLACSFAEEKAKENAIHNFSGQIIEINTNETCLSEECSFLRETNANTTGAVKNVKNKKVNKYVESGQKVCFVEIEAEVVAIQNRTIFSLKEFNHIFRVNDEVNFSAFANKPGKIIVFNFTENKYHKLYEKRIDTVNSEFKIPSDKRIVAFLPNNIMTNKEKLTFVYLELDIPIKKVYNGFEMKKFLSSIPVEQKSVVNRFVQIVR
jgi:hypothetical protein